MKLSIGLLAALTAADGEMKMAPAKAEDPNAVPIIAKTDDTKKTDHSMAIDHSMGTDHSKATDHSMGTDHSKATDHSMGTDHKMTTGHSMETDHSKTTDHSMGTDHSKATDHSMGTDHSKATDHSMGTDHSMATKPIKPTEPYHSMKPTMAPPTNAPKPTMKPTAKPTAMPTQKPQPKPCEGSKCGCNAAEMEEWKYEMGNWKHYQEEWKREFRHWQAENGGDMNYNDDMKETMNDMNDFDWNKPQVQPTMPTMGVADATQFAEWLMQADQICPLMGFVNGADLGIADWDLQKECQFQAENLAGFAKLFMNMNSYTNKDWANYMCEYVGGMVYKQMDRYGAGHFAPAAKWSMNSCACLTNIIMDAAEGNFNLMALPICANNVQQYITQTMTFVSGFDVYSEENLKSYIMEMRKFLEGNNIKLDFQNENYMHLFRVWGLKVDNKDVESVFKGLAEAWAWNLQMETGVTLKDFVSILQNVDEVVGFYMSRIAKKVDLKNEDAVAKFLSDEKNRMWVSDGKALEMHLKFYNDQALNEYVITLQKAFEDVVVDWESTDVKHLLMYWGLDNFSNEDAIYKGLANAWAWNLAYETDVKVFDFVESIKDAKFLVNYYNHQIVKMGIDLMDDKAIANFLMKDENRMKVMDMADYETFKARKEKMLKGFKDAAVNYSFDWEKNKNIAQVFKFWGLEVDFSNEESVFWELTNALEWNNMMETGLTIDGLLDLLNDAELVLEFYNKRMKAFGVDIDNEQQVEKWLANSMNRMATLDYMHIDYFVYGFVSHVEFRNKLEVFQEGFDMSVLDAGWSLANWADNNLQSFGTETFVLPTFSEHKKLENFFKEVVMSKFAALEWDPAYVINLIDCFSVEELRDLIANENWEDYIIEQRDWTKRRCLARVPDYVKLYAIEADDFTFFNANGLDFLKDRNFADLFNIKFDMVTTGFDLENLVNIDLVSFNKQLKPYFDAFDIFQSEMGFDFGLDTSEITADNIQSFNVKRDFAGSFKNLAEFMFKLEMQDKFYKDMEEFNAGVQEWMSQFGFWISNIAGWLEAYEARKEYIFKQRNWNFNAEGDDKWERFVQNPSNWGQVLYGNRSWKTFSDIMTMAMGKDEHFDMEKTLGWMQLLSGKSVDEFNFMEWAMKAMEDDYSVETQFWNAMNTHYRDTFNSIGFPNEWNDQYNYNAAAVVATGHCLTKDFPNSLDGFKVQNFVDEKFEDCFDMMYVWLNSEWSYKN